MLRTRDPALSRDQTTYEATTRWRSSPTWNEVNPSTGVHARHRTDRHPPVRIGPEHIRRRAHCNTELVGQILGQALRSPMPCRRRGMTKAAGTLIIRGPMLGRGSQRLLRARAPYYGAEPCYLATLDLSPLISPRLPQL